MAHGSVNVCAFKAAVFSQGPDGRVKGLGWTGLGLTYLHLDEVGLAKGDELRVRLQLVHVPGLHQGQPVDRALLLWTGGGNKLESCVFLEVTTTTTTTWLTSKRTKPTPGVEITPLFKPVATRAKNSHFHRKRPQKQQRGSSVRTISVKTWCDPQQTWI